jgi:hypothetical protein
VLVVVTMNPEAKGRQTPAATAPPVAMMRQIAMLKAVVAATMVQTVERMMAVIRLPFACRW